METVKDFEKELQRRRYLREELKKIEEADERRKELEAQTRKSRMEYKDFEKELHRRKNLREDLKRTEEADERRKKLEAHMRSAVQSRKASSEPPPVPPRHIPSIYPNLQSDGPSLRRTADREADRVRRTSVSPSKVGAGAGRRERPSQEARKMVDLGGRDFSR